MPISGRKEHTKKICAMLVWSAISPSTADPIPAIPKANPKNRPDIIPTFPGISSVAYTKMAEKAEEIMTPIIIAKRIVPSKFI